MNITGIKELVASDGKTVIPMEDIHKFVIFHKTNEYGLKIKAFIKPELCTVRDINGGGIIKEGKYKDFKVFEEDIFCAGSRPGSRERISREIANHFIVLGKYNKCREKLMRILKKKGEQKQSKSVVMTGMNSGFVATSNYIEVSE